LSNISIIKTGLAISRSHYVPLKNGGMAIIGAPNRRCLLYRLYLFLEEIIGRFPKRFERGFTKSEFLQLGETIGFRDIKVLPSSSFWTKDVYKFIVHPAMKVFGWDSEFDKRFIN